MRAKPEKTQRRSPWLVGSVAPYFLDTHEVELFRRWLHELQLDTLGPDERAAAVRLRRRFGARSRRDPRRPSART